MNVETGNSELPQSATRALSCLLLAAAVVRLALWIGFRDQPLTIWDEKEYDALASTLVATGEYAFKPGGDLTSLRPPLYPAFVAAIYAISGTGNYAAVRLAQAALSLVTVIVLFALARRALPCQAALWTTSLYCFYPSLLGFNNLLLTETLFTLLLMTTCWLVVRTFGTSSVLCSLFAGFTLGFAALTRSIVWLAPPLVAVYLMLVLDANWSRRFAVVGGLILGFALVVTPWVIRNTRLQKTFIAIDTMGGRNFMMGNYQYTPLYRSWDAISIQGEQSWAHEVHSAYPPEQRPTQGFVDKLALRQGIAFVKANPGLTLKRDIVKFFDFWGLERELIAGAGRGYFGSLPRIALIGIAAVICSSYAAVLFLAIFGILTAPLADRRVTWLLLAITAYICGLHTATFGHSRYHLPIVPFLMVFAASAVTQVPTIFRNWRRPSFLVATGLCVMFVASWLWTFFVVDRALLTSVIHS